MHIQAIKFGRRVTANFNKLIGRYPGADGMKTGFICASGFNLVATATRNNKRLIAVVLGAQSSSQRTLKAAQLLERGFGSNKLTWLKPSLGTVDALAPIDASPPNMRDEICGPKRKRPAAENEEDDPDIQADNNNDSGVSMFTAGLQGPTMKVSDLLAMPAAATTPVIVYTGPARTGAAILEADAAEAANQAASVAKRKKGAKPKVAAKPDAGTPAKPEKKDEKTAAKPEAKPAVSPPKPKTAAVTPAAKPAGAPKTDKKPDAAAKPAAAKPAAAKPAGDKPPAAKPAAAAKPPAAASSAAKPATAAPAAKPAAKPAAQQKPDAAPRG